VEGDNGEIGKVVRKGVIFGKDLNIYIEVKRFRTAVEHSKKTVKKCGRHCPRNCVTKGDNQNIGDSGEQCMSRYICLKKVVQR